MTREQSIADLPPQARITPGMSLETVKRLTQQAEDPWRTSQNMFSYMNNHPMGRHLQKGTPEYNSALNDFQRQFFAQRGWSDAYNQQMEWMNWLKGGGQSNYPRGP